LDVQLPLMFDATSPDALLFEVVRADGAWKILHGGKVIGSYSAAARAVSRARERARAAADKSTATAIVKVTGRDGNLIRIWTSPKRPYSTRRRPAVPLPLNDPFDP
jgi:hypothetical protein